MLTTYCWYSIQYNIPRDIRMIWHIYLPYFKKMKFGSHFMTGSEFNFYNFSCLHLLSIENGLQAENEKLLHIQSSQLLMPPWHVG